MSNPAIYSGSNVTSFATLLTEIGSSVAPTGRSGRVFGSSRTGNELERMRQESRHEGFEQGQTEGYAAGRAEGYADGIRSGYEDAKREADAEHQARLQVFSDELTHVARLVGQGVANWTQSAEQQLTDIVGQIAREVLSQELKIDRSSVLSIVKQAMREVTLSDKARIRVNPFDSELLQTHKEEILACAPSVRGLEILDDPTILGGCIVDTEGGRVDATIEGQLGRFDDSIEDAA